MIPRFRVITRLVTVIAASVLTGCGGAAQISQIQPERIQLRHLVLMLDGVPYALIDSLKLAGHFAGFYSPSKVVSPFPSLTGPSFSAVWGTGPKDGYEDLYYDAERRRIRGGLLEHTFKPREADDFHRLIDFQAGGLEGGLAYLFPQPIANSELRGLKRAVAKRAVTDSVLVGYVVSTDALGHRAGKQALIDFVVELEQWIGELRAASGDRIDVTLVSDHGNDLVPTRMVDLDAGVRAAGYRPARKIDDAKAVVLPAFGLVGSAFLYGSPQSEPRLANVLRRVEGVDLTIFQDDDGRVHVLSERGEALVEVRGDRYRYSVSVGDPLELLPIVDAMAAAGELDRDGYANEAAWLRRTIDTEFADAPRRIVRAMRDQVQNPASVIVSLEPGYHFGSAAADFLVSVTGTHGSLRTSSSLAFLMSTRIAAPPVLRSHEVTKYLPLNPGPGS